MGSRKAFLIEPPLPAILGLSPLIHPLDLHSGNQSLSGQALAVSISALASICHVWALGKTVPSQLAYCALLGISLSNKSHLGHFAPNSVLQGGGYSHDAIFNPSSLLGGMEVSLAVTQLS